MMQDQPFCSLASAGAFTYYEPRPAGPMLPVQTMARADKIIRAEKITTTDTASWQSECLEWAKNRQAFEVHGVRQAHLTFCQELSAAYNLKYRYSMADSSITFLPEN